LRTRHHTSASLCSGCVCHQDRPASPFTRYPPVRALHSFPTRRSSDLHSHVRAGTAQVSRKPAHLRQRNVRFLGVQVVANPEPHRSEEHTSELQSHLNLVCRLLLEKKNTISL